MMFRRRHPFGTRQFAGEHLRLVDEHRKMLRTDPHLLIAIENIDKGDLFLRLFADEALSD